MQIFSTWKTRNYISLTPYRPRQHPQLGVRNHNTNMGNTNRLTTVDIPLDKGKTTGIKNQFWTTTQTELDHVPGQSPTQEWLWVATQKGNWSGQNRNMCVCVCAGWGWGVHTEEEYACITGCVQMKGISASYQADSHRFCTHGTKSIILISLLLII